MIDILSGPGRHTLDRFARLRLLVAFDYDGTLAPIVARPYQARMRLATRGLLRQVARRYPCVVISGRARADVVRRLHTIPVVHVSGNHGLEPWAEKARYIAQVQGWVTLLRETFGPYAGVIVEDKMFSVSIHYRAALHPRLVLAAIDLVAPRLKGVRRINGKKVVNFLPRGAPGKGVALERARRLLGCQAAMYVGDDDTDEDAFATGPDGGTLGVRVGPVRRSRAHYLLEHQGQIDALLRQLLALRPESASR